MTEEQVRAALPMRAAVAAVRDAFVALAAGEFELPLRSALGDGRFLTMSARHTPSQTAVIKSVSIAFDRQPAIDGVVAFLSLGSDGPLIMDAEGVTALRTGAASGVATDLLAPTAARRLTLVGLGAQAADQLRAVRAVREIEHVTLVARRADAATAFRDRHADELRDVEVQLATSVNDAVAGAHVICCATPAAEPLFGLRDLPDRVHVNAVGSFRPTMRELPDDLLAAATVVVDQREAALAEAGEISHALASGALTEDALLELGHVLTEPPAAPAARTVFKSVGLAVQDWAIGHALAQL